MLACPGVKVPEPRRGRRTNVVKSSSASLRAKGSHTPKSIHTCTRHRTCMYTHTHAYVRMYIHTQIHTYIHACIHTYIHTHTNTQIHKYTKTHMHHVYTYFRICLLYESSNSTKCVPILPLRNLVASDAMPAQPQRCGFTRQPVQLIQQGALKQARALAGKNNCNSYQT